MEDSDKFLYKKESYDIIEACQEVWREFGGSFKEAILDRALDIALRERGYRVESQKRIDIYFKNKKVGVYVPDKVINEIILLEIKCKPFLAREDERQFWHYLKASPYKLGFLINFSPKRLEFKRRIYDKARK
ncbi:MAG: hypothetical protein LiPW39_494 [Parcubacteria group bacterium LiPW_39]|nr:MAG: hypothetical protein LiPW39_494 [Parcubacteria group bacterium LiPW_39]